MTILVKFRPPVAMKMRTPATSETTKGRPRATTITRLAPTPERSAILGNAMMPASFSLGGKDQDHQICRTLSSGVGYGGGKYPSAFYGGP